MTAQLDLALDVARSLPREQQRQLIEALLDHLDEEPTLELQTTRFWKPQSIKELANQQRVQVVRDVKDLKADFWPKDESVDDFISFIYEQRRLDREQNP